MSTEPHQDGAAGHEGGGAPTPAQGGGPNPVVEETRRRTAATAQGISEINQFFGTFQVGETPHSDAHGADQHLMLWVPTDETRLNLGKEYPAYNHYNGFSLSTKGHFLISAMHGDPKKSMCTVESKGHLAFQTLGADTTLFASAKAGSLVSGNAKLIASGHAGTIIRGGAGGLLTNLWADPRTGKEPALADAGSEVAGFTSATGTFAQTADAVVAALCLKSQIASSRKNAQAKGFTACHAAAISSGIQSVASGLSGWAGQLGLPNAPFGGTVAYGDIAMILGTPGYASIYGGLGLTLAAGYESAVYSLDVGAFGGAEARLAAGHTVEISAGKEVQVVGTSAVKASSREGSAYLMGAQVNVGRGRSVKNVSVSAAEAVGFHSDKILNLTARGTVGISAGKSFVTASDTLGISSDVSVAFSVGSAHVSVLKSGIGVIIFSSALPAPPEIPDAPDKPLQARDVSTYDSKLKSHQKKAASELKKHGKKVSKQKGGPVSLRVTKSKIEFDAAGAKLTGYKSKWKVNNTALVAKCG